MTTALSAALEREHRAIDDSIEAFAGSSHVQITADQRAALLNAVAVLRRHIYVEEEYLFPPLREAGLFGPVMVMVHEHGEMWTVLYQLEELLTADNIDTASLLCRGLLAQLATHNVKEERILYPQADDVLPAVERDGLIDLLATAEVPDGWVSRGVPQADRAIR